MKDKEKEKTGKTVLKGEDEGKKILYSSMSIKENFPSFLLFKSSVIGKLLIDFSYSLFFL